MKNCGIFKVIWCILWPFGIFRGYLVYFVVIWYLFFHFGIYVIPRNIWQPWYVEYPTLNGKTELKNFWVSWKDD
jgi:hypothetical protein